MDIVHDGDPNLGMRVSFLASILTNNGDSCDGRNEVPLSDVTHK